MMSTRPATTTATALPHVEAGLAGLTHAASAAERPAYRYAGDGHWLPANAAAHEECRRWNEYAERVTRLSAARRRA